MLTPNVSLTQPPQGGPDSSIVSGSTQSEVTGSTGESSQSVGNGGGKLLDLLVEKYRMDEHDAEWLHDAFWNLKDNAFEDGQRSIASNPIPVIEGYEGATVAYVMFEYDPGSPGCSYMPNGDPGYPGEPGYAYYRFATVPEIVAIDSGCETREEIDAFVEEASRKKHRALAEPSAPSSETKPVEQEGS